jgi:hypothetical protein
LKGGSYTKKEEDHKCTQKLSLARINNKNGAFVP